jgi:hypothetical protein
VRQNNPTGKSVENLSRRRDENISVFRHDNSCYGLSVPPDERGVRTSRTRGGMRWTLLVDETIANQCGRRNRADLTPSRQVSVASRASVLRGGDKKAQSHRGEHV